MMETLKDLLRKEKEEVTLETGEPMVKKDFSEKVQKIREQDKIEVK
jgi:molybdenum cofactor biosynthesis enzyme MoaA